MWLDPRLPKRFWDKIIVTVSGCWLWCGCRQSGGYGQIRVNKKALYTHRFAYTALVGEIPLELELDHKCRERSCCNPNHLEPVTRQVNIKRGDICTGPRRCGHSWDDSYSWGKCKLCHRKRQKKRYEEGLKPLRLVTSVQSAKAPF